MAGTNLGTAFVQIEPSAKGISGSISKVLKGESASAGKASGLGIVSAVKTAIVGAGIGVVLAKSLSAGAELQQSLGGVETLFKDNADTVIANAQRAYETAGMSANEYMETVTGFSASLLQSLGGDTAAAAEKADMALVDMSDNANKFGTDMESIKNAYAGFAKQNYTMLDNLKLGYGGTKSEMKRLLSDAQELTGVEYDINNLSDVYDAIHAIQENLDITGTTAKEASSTFSGSFASMKAAATNVLGSLALGEDIQGPLNALLQSVMTFLTGNLLPMVINVVSALPSALSTILTTMGPILVGYLRDGIFTGLPLFVSTAPQMVSDFCNELLANAPSFLSSASDCVTELVVGLVRQLPAVLGAADEIASTILQTMGDLAIELITAGATCVKNIADQLGITSTITAAAEGIKTAVLTPIETARDKVKEIVDKIVGFFNVTITFPHVPYPHFSISPSGWKISDLLQGVIPTLNISTYANGGIFGMTTGANLGVIGEAGPEAVVPLDRFWKTLEKRDSVGGSITINVYGTEGQSAKEIAEEVEQRLIYKYRRANAW